MAAERSVEAARYSHPDAAVACCDAALVRAVLPPRRKAMFMVREVLNCQPGKVGELVKKFRALGDVMQEMDLEPFRIYTDVAGEAFWTLVLEREYDSLDAVPTLESKVMADKRAQSAMSGYHDLVRSGRREIYKVES
jgi:hypothetical protein